MSYGADRQLRSARLEASRIELAQVRLDAARTLGIVQIALLSGGGAAAAAQPWIEAQPTYLQRLDEIARTFAGAET